MLENGGGTVAAVTPQDGVEGSSDGDLDVVLVGGLPLLLADLDGDGETEVVLEAAITAGTANVFRTAEGPGDPDPDLVFVGGVPRGAYDADSDSEAEVVVENGSGGASTRLDTVDGLGDSDADLIFTGGRVVLFADLDNDGELEALAEDAAAMSGSADDWAGADGDGDFDVIYLKGAIQGGLDLDGDGELEAVASDAGLAGGAALDPGLGDGDLDADAALIGIAASGGSPSLALSAPNGGGSATLGNPLTITWTASGFAGNVRIELSRDGGTTWETLFANTANDGSEVWVATGSATAAALVRVTSRNLATPVSDDSDAVFSLI